MLKKDPNYRRLKFGGAGLMSNSTYWLAQDHLLIVESANYAERYRRFYLRDIQAVIIQENRARWWWNFGFIVCACLALLVLLQVTMGNSSSGRIVRGDRVVGGIWLIITLIFGVMALVNHLRGPTCLVQIRTAVQTLKLPNLVRRRKAERFLADLTPLVAIAQQMPAAPATTAPATVTAVETPPDPAESA